MLQSTQADGIAYLKEFAKSCGGRVRSCMHFDPNVDEELTAQYKYRLAAISVLTRASPSYFSHDVACETGMSFAIGRIDRILGATSRLNTMGPSGSEIYVRPERDNSDVRAWLEHVDHRKLIASLDLREDEAVHVFGNRVVVTLRVDRGLSRELMESVWNLAQAFARDQPKPDAAGDEAALPQPLRDLLRRFRHFAISDDALREEALEELDETERDALVQQVGSQLPAINSYLDTLSEPWPDAARRLSSLAQAASELLVERRGQRS